MDKKEEAEFMKLLNRLYAEQIMDEILEYYRKNNLKIKK